MPASANPAQRGGRRQPFGFLHANTITSSSDTGKAKGGSDALSAAGGGPAAAAEEPLKRGSKKKFRGVLTSIVSRRGRGRKNDRSSSEGSSSPIDLDTPLPESPAKKARDTKDAGEDSKPCAISVTGGSQFAASDVASIFRQRPAAVEGTGGPWDSAELEGMLELKRANPIDEGSYTYDQFVDIDSGEVIKSKDETICPSACLAQELDENVPGEPLLQMHRVEEGKDGGFIIYTDSN